MLTDYIDAALRHAEYEREDERWYCHIPGLPGAWADGDPVEECRRALRSTTFLLYGGAAAFIIAIHLATSGIPRFQIDELYYLFFGGTRPNWYDMTMVTEKMEELRNGREETCKDGHAAVH